MSEKKSEFITLLENELETHWKNTKEERERTHTAKLYQNIDLRKEV